MGGGARERAWAIAQIPAQPGQCIPQSRVVISQFGQARNSQAGNSQGRSAQGRSAQDSGQAGSFRFFAPKQIHAVEH